MLDLPRCLPMLLLSLLLLAVASAPAVAQGEPPPEVSLEDLPPEVRQAIEERIREAAELGTVTVLRADGERAERLPADAPDEVFSDLIEVRVVDIEVVVTDDDGERVPGLTADDFVLRVDGEETPIEYFSEVRDHRPAMPRVAEGTAASAAVPAGEIEAASAGAERGNSLLVFIDDYFTVRKYRQALFERLLADLDSLGPADRMALVRFAGQGLEVLTEWTSSKPEMRAALEQARQAKPGELKREAQLSGLTASGAAGDHYVRLLSQQIDKVVDAAAVTLRSLPDPGGRKLLVLASSGWPYDVGTMAEAGGELFPGNLRYSSERRLERIADVANLLGYTIYPLHLGLGGVPELASSSGPVSPGFDVASSIERRSLRLLAEETGGEMLPFAIVKPSLPLEWVREATRSYYVLGFSPEMRQSGARHRVEVSLRPPGLEAHHRAGYRDLTRREQASMAAEAALLLGSSAPPTSSALEVTLGEPQRKGLGKVRVPVEVRIPMDEVLALKTSSGRYASRLELRVAALDERGDRSEMAVIPIRLRGAEPDPGDVTVYEAEVDLRRKDQRLVFSLYDRLGDGVLTTTLDFTP